MTTFPTSSFPRPMRALLKQCQKSLLLHPTIVALPMLTIAGAAIGNSRRLQLTPDYSIPPNIWSAILAPTEMPHLTRLIQLLLSPLAARQEAIVDNVHDLHAQYADDFRLWKLTRDERPRPLKPVPPPSDYRQIFFTDGDHRHLPTYLARQRRGCLIVQNDLTPWFKSTPTQILSLFDANPFTFDRAKSLNARFSPRPFLAITGSVSPGTLLHSSPDSTATRLASRFLLTAPTQTHRPSSLASLNPIVIAHWEKLLFRLHNLEPTPNAGSIKPVFIPLHRKAKPHLVAAQSRLAEAAQNESDPALQNHLLNLIDFIPRIALIFQFAQPIKDACFDFVDAYSITTAASVVQWFFDEAKRIHTDLAVHKSKNEIQNAVTLIARLGGSITARQLMRAHRPFSHSATLARAFLEQLVSKGLGHFAFNSTANQKSPIFHLNPRADADNSPSGAIKNEAIVSAPFKNPP